jgi:hypothetical protein
MSVMKNRKPKNNDLSMIHPHVEGYPAAFSSGGIPTFFSPFKSTTMEKGYNLTINSSSYNVSSFEVSSSFSKTLIFNFLSFIIGIGGDFEQRCSSENRINNEGEHWKKEPYGNYNMSMELLDKCDAYSKHFFNDQASTTVHIASGPIHYQENGKWKTIYHSIETSINGGFQNNHNSFKMFYPASANGSIETILPNGMIMRDMNSMRMYYEGNWQELSVMNISGSAGITDFNVLTYPGVYRSEIDLRLTQSDLII